MIYYAFLEKSSVYYIDQKHYLHAAQSYYKGAKKNSFYAFILLFKNFCLTFCSSIYFIRVLLLIFIETIL